MIFRKLSSQRSAQRDRSRIDWLPTLLPALLPRGAWLRSTRLHRLLSRSTWIPRCSLLLLCAPFLLGANSAAAQESCPDLAPYYQSQSNDWRQLVERLIVLQPRCLQSAEYYALLGAAELNSGYLEAGREALERALLLQPDHGAAAIDYAQALYLLGEEFAALDLSAQLLARSDLPPELGTGLRQRHEAWQARTRSSGFTAEMAFGYDDNLNGAPARSEFTLTLADGIIEVPVDERFRPISGPYANFRFGGYSQRRSAERTHDFNYALRNRQSESSDAELLQGDLRYALAIPLRHLRWDLSAGTTHLLYGGSPLFTATDFRMHLRQLGEGCQPVGEFALQHQLYHQQSFMAGVESSLTGGVECRLRDWNANLAIEGGRVENHALKSRRPGGDREGWIVRAGWQQGIGTGMLRIQYSLANLEDVGGYNELLQDNAPRRILSRQFRLLYQRPLKDNLSLQFNVSHQRQGSNLTPFENHGTAVDLGVNLAF